MFERNAIGFGDARQRVLALGVALVGLLGPAPLLAKTPGVEAPPDAGALKTQGHLVSVGAYGGSFALANDFDGTSFSIGGRVTYLPLWYLGGEFEGGVLRTFDTGFDTHLLVLYSVRLSALFQYPLTRRFALFGVVGVGVTGTSHWRSVERQIVGPSAHWGGGIKWHLLDEMAVRIDFRHLLTMKLQELGRNILELTVGVSIVLNWTPDRDGDGVSDKRDRCPRIKADNPDGCPTRDTDRDGVPDHQDKCPRQWSVTPTGCPHHDTDNDGIVDEYDMCPSQPETKNGYYDSDGCPDAPLKLKQYSGRLAGIFFDTGKATIKARSHAVLKAAARVLRMNPRVRILVIGYADSTGGAALITRLSVARARAVRRFLVRAGVDGKRIEAAGRGAKEPRATNATDAGRAQNKRIEFLILSR